MNAEKKEMAIFALVAVVVTFIFYGRFVNNFFAYDDFKYLGNFSSGLPDVALGYNTLRLVSNLAWAPIYFLSGLNPIGYNLFGFALYAANGLLLYLFLLHLAKDRSFAFLGGLFFLSSSVGADAVFWKATNSSLISLFFYLTTLITYQCYRSQNKKKFLIVSLTIYLLAIFSKEEAASLPFILLLIDFIFLDAVRDKRAALLRIVPFAAIIVLYILSNWLVFNHLLHGHAEPEKLFQFRPLHTLLTGWSVFFLSPQGTGISPANPAVYLTAAGIVFSFFFIKDRRLLYFGLGWIFFAFLPQSLTLLGQLEPRNICNSISRYLYITSIGSAIVLSALTLRIKEKYSRAVSLTAVTVVLVIFATYNFMRVQERGKEWQEEWEPMRYFLTTVKKITPVFPADSHIFVANPPTGRSFVMQGLQAFYQDPDIKWIYELSYTPNAGEHAFLIYASMVTEGVITVIPFTGPLGDTLLAGRQQGWIGPVPGVLD